MSVRGSVFALFVCLAGASSLSICSAAEVLQERFDFRVRILPALTKAGCNSGACHGAAVGQGGFRLSLLGYDPDEDLFRITRELGGRRIDLEAPEESLLLRMARGELDHEGGRRLRRESAGYKTLRNWIAAGAPAGAPDLRVTGITVTPDDSLVARAGETVQLRVTAELSDGTREDVTPLALFDSNDEALAMVAKDGAVTARGRGLTSIMVRYGGAVAAARIAVPVGDAEVDAATFPPANEIDRHIFATLQKLRARPSQLSSDAEFLRRIHLDLTGRLPDAAEAREFLREGMSPEKRSELIERLLVSEDFVDFWTMRLGDLLMVGGKRGADAATRAYHGWLREQIARHRPWDETARALLTAEGELARSGPANFFTLASDPRDMAEHAARIFMGSQIACARCHAHPADRWTQEDYHQFAAFFARVSRDGGKIRESHRGEVDHPKTGQPVAPKPLGADGPMNTGLRRANLAKWLTSPGNPFFARAIVNRIWKELMGRGLVEPVDDLRPTNPPTHPELLDALCADFVAQGLDLRRLIRAIVTSRAYQLSSGEVPGNRSDDRLFARAQIKPLPAQVLADAIAQATGVADRFDDYPEGTRAVQLIGTQTVSYTLDVLGRCSRASSCDSAGRSGGGLAQALHLINGPVVSGKLRGGVLTRFLEEELADRTIIEELYLRSLTRLPTAGEFAEWEPLLSQAADRREVLEDLLWALLNSREFSFNH